MKTKFLIPLLFLALVISAGAQSAFKISGGTGLVYSSTNPATYSGAIVSSDTTGNGALVTSSQFEQFPFTPTIGSGTAYAAYEVVGVPLNLTAAVRQAGGGAELKSVLTIDAGPKVTNPPLQILFFDESTASLTGTYADHSAAGISVADLTHVIRSAAISNASYIAVGGTGNSVSDVAVNEPALASGTNTALSALVLCTGTTPTTSASNSYTFKFIFNKD
jgi:hypothetical protein